MQGVVLINVCKRNLAQMETFGKSVNRGRKIPTKIIVKFSTKFLNLAPNRISISAIYDINTIVFAKTSFKSNLMSVLLLIFYAIFFFKSSFFFFFYNRIYSCIFILIIFFGSICSYFFSFFSRAIARETKRLI